ncbi:TPM domain-containing protein [Pseudolysinimonas yzui]|uniref:Membrane protein n=1 Tax=Pseudolysinimonas yzui TaxID=2708254 RepID=A0A8J3LZW8_9MICO|nr:TPM domain-containing protein [Pseudolysinimonas yzui]GHF06977.1 membrane protein [Pseudolysinimonas yzui]
MRPLPTAGALVAGAALVLMSPGPAVAEPPVDFAGAYVIDQAGVLGSTFSIESALDDLYDRAEVSLFVVYVDTFDDPSDRELWADTTAGLSGFGPDDVLLAIAVEDRLYALNDELLFDDQYDRVSARIETQLRDDHWEEAALEAADAIGDELAGENPTEPGTTDGEGGGIPILPILAGVGVVGVGAWGISRLVKRRRGVDPTAPVEKLDQKQLDQRAGSLLVSLDDALQSNEQELGFAQAQFGEKATKGFAAALAEAEKQVKQAFAIRQQLDDATPETADEKRRLTTEIIRLCEAASASLAAQSADFEQLRQLETNAPAVLETVAATHGGLPSRIDAAEATVAALSTKYGAAAVASVRDSAAQSRELAAFAATAIAEARAALEAGKASEAAVAVRGAQQAVGQVERAISAVDKLAADLPALVERLTAGIADVKRDVAEARAGLASAAPEIAEPLRVAVDDAEKVLARADTGDPASAIGEVERVNATLHEALGKLRDAAAQAERAKAQLARVTSEAQAAVAAAKDFIATRRGAVGATARTRVAEAERQLTQALTAARTDPVEALRAAQQAVALATSAMQSAQSDVAAFNGGGSTAPSGGGYGGAALGGILDGLFSGGSSGGWSSSGGGGWSSGSSWSRPRPRPRPSSSSSRPRPSGGRRSRGGRF